MFYTYKQLDCALGSEVISEICLNRRELRPDTYLPSPYYQEGGADREVPAAGCWLVLSIVPLPPKKNSSLGKRAAKIGEVKGKKDKKNHSS